MGMAANQARLMTLTARQSDLELRAQQISARKMRLAMEQQQVATEYSNSLNGAFGNYSSVRYTTRQRETSAISADIRNIVLNNPTKEYFLRNGSNEFIANQYSDFDQYAELLKQGYSLTVKTETTFAGSSSLTSEQILAGLKVLYPDFVPYANGYGEADGQYFMTFKPNSVVLEGPDAGVPLFEIGGRSAANTIEAMQNSWFSSNVGRGSYTEAEIANAIHVPLLPAGSSTKSVSYLPVNVPITETFQEAVDPSAPAPAVDVNEAARKYDTAINTLAAQEKMFDLELTQINTEHTAVKTEYDSIQSLIKDNVDKSFNIFG